MTKTEKQLLIEKLGEYAFTYGYYLEMYKHENNKEDGDCLAEAAKVMHLVQEVLDCVGIDYEASRATAIETGIQRYVENHPIRVGAYVKTPRFCTVQLKEVFTDKHAANEAGYVEPTHYENEQWDILGKHTGINRMVFAAVKKKN
ncbi:hypothetical protein [Sporomusa acidovorans]|uniref:Uncharacterized protein n=1 Tax=Sporomusa acidovorans (strain ATCC 49682 / DSM 3132 / Mol) TaxID=1123286 RepID=A0ABZ3J6M5_SPOA4|nr:hypothetical protein [Sporomusa acidovorans]OZC23832.1 hypothetical protein SPACI_04570 [Sporomusa acidovorans DSM 3132]SDF62467.1 hypothetical protein SAMN04488499_106337 [Sporomusa acidovorans]